MTITRDRSDLCPGVFRPWPADDGALVRLRPPGGLLPSAALLDLVGVAETYGDGPRLGVRPALELAEVLLAQTYVEDQLAAEQTDQELRGLPGADQVAGADHVDGGARAEIGTDQRGRVPGLRAAELGEPGGHGLALGELADVPLRLAVPDQVAGCGHAGIVPESGVGILSGPATSGRGQGTRCDSGTDAQRCG